MHDQGQRIRIHGFLSPLHAAVTGAAVALFGLVMSLSAGPVGLVFAYSLIALGIAAIGLRNGTDLDTGRGLVIRWWGYIIPLIRQQEPTSAIERVHLDKEMRTSKTGSNTWLVYPLRLERAAGAALELCAHRDYRTARADAERAAKALQLSLHDNSGIGKSVREWDRLDESLAARCRRLDINPALPDIPRDAGLELGRGPAGEAVIRLKPAGLQWEHGIGIAFMAGLVAAVISSLVAESGGQDRDFMLTGLMTLPVLIGGGAAATHMIGRALSSEFVTAAGTRLCFPGHGLTYTRCVDIGEIEEIEFSGASQGATDRDQPLGALERMKNRLGLGNQVRIRGDWGMRGIGGHLSPADQQRLHDALLHIILTGPDTAAMRIGAGRLELSAGPGATWRNLVLVMLALATLPVAAWHTAAAWPAGLKSAMFGRTLPPRPAKHYALIGEGMVAQREGDVLVVTVQKIGIRPLGPQRASQYRWPAMQIGVRPSGEWEQLGEQRLPDEAVSFAVPEGATLHHIGAREFRFDGLGQRCHDTRCYARLELHLQLPDGRWDWGAAGPTPPLILP